MKHLLIILSIVLLSYPVIGQSSKNESVIQCVLQTMEERELTGNEMFELVKEECEVKPDSKSGESGKKNLSILAKEIMKWMQANCDIPGVHPSHNFCDMNMDLPIPKITLMTKKQIKKEYINRHGILQQVDGRDQNVSGFYDDGEIWLVHNDYSTVEYQSDLVHELAHYIQDKNNSIDWDCPPHYEIPVYLMQLYFYAEKTGRVATVPLLDTFKRQRCNTLYP